VRELRAVAALEVDAPPAACLAFLADVEAYPGWCPDTVRRAELVEEGLARVTLRLGVGPLAGNFEELMVVAVEPPDRVSTTRVPHDTTDPERLEVNWRIEPGPLTRLRVELAAALELPRLVPLGGLVESVAQGLVAAASRALGPSSPMASASSS
jgi:hypothetical protein